MFEGKNDDPGNNEIDAKQRDPVARSRRPSRLITGFVVAEKDANKSEEFHWSVPDSVFRGINSWDQDQMRLNLRAQSGGGGGCGGPSTSSPQRPFPRLSTMRH